MAWLVALLVAFPATRALGSDPSSYVVRGELRVVCPMTVGGSFEAKTGAIRGTVTPGAPGAALGGDLTVDLATLDTGIDLRNEHLRNKYLEVGRGPAHPLRPLALAPGAVDDGPVRALGASAGQR